MDIKMQGHKPDPPSKSYWPFSQLDGQLDKVRTSDLRHYSGKVHDQRTTNSCVANALTKALEIRERYARSRSGFERAHTDISRLHLYYLSRSLHQHRPTDNGTYISLACGVLKDFGVMAEADWPFLMEKVNKAPSMMAMRQAYSHKILGGYYRITSTGAERIEDVARALANNYPVVFGTPVDDSWTSYRGQGRLGVVHEPRGRHATVLVGWTGREFIGENSWSERWGNKGCYAIDPEVIAHKDSKDFWVLQGSWEKVPI